MKPCRKITGCLFLALFLAASSSWAEVSELVRLRVKVALLNSLENSKVQGRVKGVRASQICDIVDYCFDSAYLTPSFGNELEAGIKLISAAYGESGFHSSAIHKNKVKDKRYLWDVGVMQVNSIHWITPAKEPTWKQFCAMMGYDDDLAQIWEPKKNIQFAAVVNEMSLKCHLKPYKFNSPKRKDQQFIYKQLKDAIK